ncbi:putative amidohydrolase YtcJ [Scopulibacillus daqui]|uniref:Amidohydrolase YtcJ n=1 Tax=Scopulibacillus daqui TaxID=1469162 RepID=A0ABS2PXP7_9BACL|nr:amidohydrolase [Scopulibacillus daqui]MBM7644823.1 putative amidohydrolase YtcJ [Scopulibacillus daqui]
MGTLWLGRVRTMVNENDVQEAIYVENGLIQEVGKAFVLKDKYKYCIDQIINMHDKTIFPGFVDSHLHILANGLKLSRLDLSTVTSSEEMKELLIRRVRETPTNQWVLGDAWNENNFPDRKIFHRRELDAIAPHHPMALTRVCQHAILANSLALAEAGIDENTPDPPGGIIVRDADGKPTGLLLDQAKFLLTEVIPQQTDAELDHICQTSIDYLLSVGCVGGHSEDLNYYGGFTRTLNAYRRILNQTNRRFRLHLLVHHEVVDDMHQAGWTSDSKIGDIEFGAMKIFADGAFGGRTALLRHPYNDVPETNGVPIHKPEELKKLVHKARTYQMPVAIHAIGDLALEYAVDAIETYPPPKGKRDRLIHGQLVPIDLRERIKKLPAAIDIQPQFVASDFPWVIERLGENRLPDAYAWKTLINEGIVCAGGSDAPIELANPLSGIYSAVTRKKPSENHQGYGPEQKLSVYDAVKLYTYGSAFIISMEGKTGRIAPGYQADFTILNKDIISIPAEEILKTKVACTVVDNQIVYHNKSV